MSGDTLATVSISSVTEALDNGESRPHMVIAKGYGLSTGLAGHPNIFTLDASNAGYGDFVVVIKGSSHATIEYTEESEMMYKIKYHVALPGDYLIEIKYGDTHIPGSPFESKVLDPHLDESLRNASDCSRSSDYRNRLDSSYSSDAHNRLGSTASTSAESFVSINELTTSEDENSNRPQIEARVQSPSQKALTGKIYRKTNGDIGIHFPRQEIGTYLVTLLNKADGIVYPGSPYAVHVTPKPKKCFKELKVSNMDEANCFTIFGAKGLDVRNLCVAVVGDAGGVKLRVFQNDCDSIDILYEVTGGGTEYLFHVHNQGRALPGSPFNINTGKKENIWQSKTDKVVSAIQTITLWHGRNIRGLVTKLVSPFDTIVAHSLVRRGRYLIQVKFLPTEKGAYSLNIQLPCGETEVFRIQVDNGRSDLFLVMGAGKQRAVVDEPNSIYVESLLPVNGPISVEIDGPDKVHITQSRTDEGKIHIAYMGSKIGEYVLSTKYDGFHIGGSPFNVYMSDGNRTSRAIESSGKTTSLAIEPSEMATSVAIETSGKVTPHSIEPSEKTTTSSLCLVEGLREAQIGKENIFTIDASKAGDGSLLVGFQPSVFTSHEVICKQVGMYAVRYRINQSGEYTVNVLWAEKHVPGSPYKLHVQNGTRV